LSTDLPYSCLIVEILANGMNMLSSGPEPVSWSEVCSGTISWYAGGVFIVGSIPGCDCAADSSLKSVCEFL
jgi:hypothetical protein